jgi:hypothetical protein
LAATKLDDRTYLTARIKHHLPRQVGNLTCPQTGLEREKNDNLVSGGSAGGGGKQQEVTGLIVRQCFRLFAGH